MKYIIFILTLFCINFNKPKALVLGVKCDESEDASAFNEQKDLFKKIKTETKIVNGKNLDFSALDKSAADIYFYNLFENSYMIIKNNKNDSSLLIEPKLWKDNTFRLTTYDLTKYQNFTVEVYSSLQYCSDNLIGILYVDKPFYNKFSELSVCSNHKDNELCNTFIYKNLDMSEKEFIKKVNSSDKRLLYILYGAFGIFACFAVLYLYFTNKRK